MVFPARLLQHLVVRERPPEYGSRPELDGRAPADDGRAPDLDGPEPGTDAPGLRPDSPEPRTDSPERKAELDAIEDLGDEIATLAAHIHAATHRLLVLIVEFDRRRGWELSGHRSCAHWLSFRTGIDLGAAREKVRAARALDELPETSASMARGELSFSKVRALTRVADAENEGELLELARGCTTAQLERIVRAWKRGDRQDEATRERERHDARRLSIFPDDDGMYVVRGRLTPEVGALLMRAVEAASDALYRAERGSGAEVGGGAAHGRAGSESSGAAAAQGRVGGPGPEAARKHAGAHGSEAGPAQAGGQVAACAHEPAPDSQKAARQRRADAVGLLAERAMAVGFGGEDGADAPISGTRAERYQVMLHVEADTLDAEAEPGRSELEDGTRVSAETSRRLACDAGLVRVTHAPDGSLLDVGRRTRTIPPALRRALEVRDRGCRFPGCGLRFTDAHHVRHWADGGETSLSNCLLLCRHHHRLVHEEGWRVDWWGEGRPVFFDPRGGTHFEGRWTPPAMNGDLPSLDAEPVEASDGRPVEASDGEPVKASDGEPVEALEDVSAEPSGQPGTPRGPHPRGDPRDLRAALEETRDADPVEALKRDNRSCEPDWRTAGARWKRLEDVPDDVFYRALEAMA